jgi:hypothetical protein
MVLSSVIDRGGGEVVTDVVTDRSWRRRSRRSRTDAVISDICTDDLTADDVVMAVSVMTIR